VEASTVAADIDDLKMVLACEPVWTVSIDNREFFTLRSGDIEIAGRSIRLGGIARSMPRRIEDIVWLRPNAARILARPRFRSHRDILTVHAGDRPPSAVETRRRRRALQAQLAPCLVRYFGARRVEREILASDKRHGVGAAYPRFFVDSRPVIAVDPDEPSPVVDGLPRAAVAWGAAIGRRVAAVVPAGRREAIVTRLGGMPRLDAACEWLQWDGRTVSPLDRGGGALETRVERFQPPGPAAVAAAARILALRPDLLRAMPNIAGRAVSIRLRGIEVASVTESETVYPLGGPPGPLEPLIADLESKRRHGSRHPLARAQEERWLEAGLIDRIDRVLPTVDVRHVYPQVPSFVGRDRHIVDLLTVTRDGRLAVIEIKAGPDPDLPFQSFDYWLAVERHRRAGDFKAAGYFTGIGLQDAPALLIVTAPLLAFHRTFDRMMEFIPPEVPWMQVGLDRAWKKEIRVLRRKGAVG
jgi:hypothetical protein